MAARDLSAAQLASVCHNVLWNGHPLAQVQTGQGER